jgi:PAS domain S-box-containing protein
MQEMRDGSESREKHNVKKNGEEFWVEISVTPVQSGGQLIYAVANWVDITERKRAEEALRQSEERFRNLVENAPVGMIISNTAQHIFDVNDALLKIHGCDSKEEFLHWPVLEHYYDPKDRDRWVAKIREEGTTKDFEIRLNRKDGTIFWASLSSIPQITESGEERIITVIQDINERKQAEERGKQLQQELIVTNRLATVGQMAAGIAHEINNPLTGVVGFAGLLLKKDVPEDIKQDVNTIYEGARRIASITSRMLLFARQRQPGRTSVNINDIIETTLAMRSYEMKSSNIKVTTELASDPPVTMVDAGQIQQVFLNIILNAEIEMKNAHQGGNLTVKTEKIDNTIRISFKDDGPGIPKKNLERIFEPFFTTREVGEGTGLGLSVSYGIVTQHGGKIYAQSRLGKGATFIVELPIVTEAEQLKLAEPAARKKKKVAGGKILVVDDEPTVGDLLNEILSGEGHDVEIVKNGDDALKRLDSEDYDVILLDIKLPGMSGIELYEHIQRTARSLASKVIFITGDVMNADTMVFIKSGQTPYVTKPFDTEQLLKSIERILS